MDSQHWWYIYGNFSPGKDNLPHIGEVIRYYLTLSGMSSAELAIALDCTERYIEMLRSNKNADMPQLLPRRVLLARLLHIPPILLGISSVTLSNGDTIKVGVESIASPGTMNFYEGLLAVSWELYYSNNVQKASNSIDSGFTMLTNDFEHATGVKRDQYEAIKCKFHQLYALVLRDRLEIQQSIEECTKAYDIAIRLKNAELIASSLLRRARTYHNINHDLAYKDAIDALPYAAICRDPLKGKCYQMAGESMSYIANGDRTLQEASLSYFARAAKIARKGDLKPDGSFTKTDLTSVYIEKAKALTLFKRYDEAHNALAIARKNLSPELTRWNVNLFIEEARTYFAEGDISSCIYTLKEVLPLVRAIKLPAKELRIMGLYESCKALEPSNAALKELEKVIAG
jgi:tetratricopeptide (TPR) repeat protein